jgi:hypothetical protein
MILNLPRERIIVVNLTNPTNKVGFGGPECGQKRSTFRLNFPLDSQPVCGIIYSFRRKPMANPYVEEGFANRKEYLEDLAANMGVSKSTVFALADMLGPNEDFDGLVTELEDMEDMGLGDFD